MKPEHVVGAIFLAYIVIKEVFVYIKGETKQIAKDMAELRASMLSKSTDNKSVVEQVSDLYSCFFRVDKNITFIKECVEDLYKWHDKEDDDGVKIWYVRRSLEEGIKRLPITMDKQRQLMDALFSVFEEVKTDLSDVKICLTDVKDKIEPSE